MELDMTVHEMTIDPTGRRASVQCTITRRFHPRIGRPTQTTQRHTLQFEKRGDDWIITRM
jgi:hypothetical protein